MANLDFIWITLAVLAALDVVASGPFQPKSGQQITITNLNGNYTYLENQPSLPFVDVSKVCKTGVWIIYTGENYQWDFGAGYGIWEVLGFLGYSCHEDLGWGNTIIGSTRFVGSPNNYSAPSVTLFDQEDLFGNTTVFEGEIPEINSPVLSILTIGTPVELFQNPNFEGESFCVDASSMYQCTPDDVCWLWWWEFENLPWDVSSSKSARAGCSASAKVYRQTGENQNAVTGYRETKIRKI